MPFLVYLPRPHSTIDLIDQEAAKVHDGLENDFHASQGMSLTMGFYTFDVGSGTCLVLLGNNIRLASQPYPDPGLPWRDIVLNSANEHSPDLPGFALIGLPYHLGWYTTSVLSISVQQSGRSRYSY